MGRGKISTYLYRKKGFEMLDSWMWILYAYLIMPIAVKMLLDFLIVNYLLNKKLLLAIHILASISWVPGVRQCASVLLTYFIMTLTPIKQQQTLLFSLIDEDEAEVLSSWITCLHYIGGDSGIEIQFWSVWFQTFSQPQNYIAFSCRTAQVPGI